MPPRIENDRHDGPRGHTAGGAQDILAAFAALGIDATTVDATTIRAGGHRLAVATVAHPTPAEAEEIGVTADLVVADRLSAAARRRLNDLGTGWLDRRGHLRVHLPGLIIDTDVPRLSAAPDRHSSRLGQTGLDIVVTLLAEPERPWGVNQLARQVARSPGRVSEVLRALRDQGLVTPTATPIVPELFWAAADAWQPRWVPLSGVPEAGEVFRQTGSRAAAALGAGLVLSADWPLELYVADEWTLRNLAANAPSGPARVVGATCPAPAALRLEADPQGGEGNLAHPVVIALDLAQDRARGREVLEAFNPEGYSRVW